MVNILKKFAAAYKHADGKKIDGKRVLVDVERARTVKGWLPRRLGGGLGGTRRGGIEVNIKHSGREDNERERERYRLERERSKERRDYREKERRSEFQFHLVVGSFYKIIKPLFTGDFDTRRRSRSRGDRVERVERVRDREIRRRSVSKERKKRRSRERRSRSREEYDRKERRDRR